MIANDERERGFLTITIHAYQMEETLVAFGMFWRFLFRKHAHQFGSHTSGVDHLILCIARMDAATCDADFGSSSVEVLKLNLSCFAAIHRVGKLTSKLLDVKLRSPHADFLVWIETHTNFPVFHFGMFHEPHTCRNNFGNTRLVVRT